MIEPAPQAIQQTQQILSQLTNLKPDRHALLIVGVGSGALIEALLMTYGPKNESAETIDSKYPFRDSDANPKRRLPVWVIEPDAVCIEEAKSRYGWQRACETGQLQFFTGKDAVSRLEEAIGDPLSQPLTNCIASPDAVISPEVRQEILNRAQAALQKRMPRKERLAGEWRENQLSTQAWRERCAAGKRLNVLLCHTRFSMFTRHSIHSLARGFEQLGHDAHLLIEKDDSQRVGPDAIQSAVNALKPDIIVTLNYPRFFLRMPDVVSMGFRFVVGCRIRHGVMGTPGRRYENGAVNWISILARCASGRMN